MTFEEYQNETARTWRGDLADELSVIALGIAGEAGEVADYVKKVRAHGKTLDPDVLIKEGGDVLYYIARLAAVLNTTLENLAAGNVFKLRARYPSGFSVAAAEAKADEKKHRLARMDVDGKLIGFTEASCSVPEECSACLQAAAARGVLRTGIGFDGNGSPTNED